MSEIPELDPKVLPLQLKDLYQKAWRLAQDHDTILHDKGVFERYTTDQWFASEFEIDSQVGLIAYQDVFEWFDEHPVHGYISLVVPTDVINGVKSVQEWADETYNKFIKSERSFKIKELSRLKATADMSRKKYAELEKELKDLDG